jgi:xylulokinase
VLNDTAFASRLNSYCHVVPNRYVTLAYFPSGIMLEWFVRLICSPDKQAGPVLENDLYAQLETQAPEAPTGLCVTPHLLGTCNPDFNPEAAGVIAGIRPSTSREDVYKGILEGIACEFASMTELLQTAVGPFDHIYVAGGGTCSGLGLRLRAALSDCTLHVVKQQEAVCLGTAILAGVALKKFSFSEALKQLVTVSRRVPPNSEVGESYRGQREQYRLMYPALAPMRRAQIAAHQGGT